MISPLDNMATILQMCISIQISLKFVPNSTIDNKQALVQLMAWHQWLGTKRQQAIICTNADPVPWGTYAGIGGDAVPDISPFDHCTFSQPQACMACYLTQTNH